MQRKPDETKINQILDLITALDGRILKVEQDNGILIVFADVKEDASSEDTTTDCPCYEPNEDDDEYDHCIHCCPECGRCLLDLDGEDC